MPTEEPTAEPTAVPTAEPTVEPTLDPTEEPTAEPTAQPTLEPTFVPSAEPTAEPTAVPTAEPTVEPTAEPTVDPTAIPTAEPTVEPTATPTEEPTLEPTPLPTFEPTPAPSALPTYEPTKAPTGCLVRAAKMHILFKDDVPLISRRLLVAMRNAALTAAFKSHEVELQAAVAQELKLPVSKVAVKSYMEKDYMHDRGGRNIWHTELRFKGLEAIALGYKLEKAVLANTFHPIPSYPIHRLYMEEVFDCGPHAVGATHTYDGLNDKEANIKWSLPDEGWEVKQAAPSK